MAEGSVYQTTKSTLLIPCIYVWQELNSEAVDSYHSQPSLHLVMWL